jgi:hypothetical protein
VDTLPVRVSCYPDPDGDQKLLPLWEADSLRRFRDQACTSATREINAILTRLQEAKPSDAELSFITFQDRLFSDLAKYDVVGSYDEDEDIAAALGLKLPTPEQSRKPSV